MPCVKFGFTAENLPSIALEGAQLIYIDFKLLTRVPINKSYKPEPADAAKLFVDVLKD